MTTTGSPIAVVHVEPLFTGAERTALAGYAPSVPAAGDLVWRLKRPVRRDCEGLRRHAA